METLRETLSYVNDWLRFAEAKNGVLVATSGVAMWGCLRLAVLPETGCYVDLYLGVAVLFLALGFVTSLLSFLPVLEYRWIIPSAMAGKDQNLLYFGHLASYSKKNLVASYRKATGCNETEETELHGMYAEQIIVNSRIALAKYALFERAVTFVLLGVLTPLVAVPLLFFAKKKRNKTDDIG